MKKDSISKVIIIVVLVIILGVLVYFTIDAINYKNSPQMMPNDNKDMMQMPSGSDDSLSVETSGVTNITNEQELASGIYESTDSNVSPIVVSDGGNLSLSNATVNKESGDSSNTENSEFYGVNSGVLVKKNSTATIKDSTITTSTKGSNAVFSTGENSKIYISDSTIETTGESSSRGLDATYGGYIEANNVKITTQGGSCATMATDRGKGTVIGKNMTLETNGAGSPLIYSTGNISLSDSKGSATSAQIAVIEGKNSATITNSNLVCSGKGNRNDVDNAGIMIYQSMSGDADDGKGTFTSKDSTLSIYSTDSKIQTTPFFFITNTTAEINLENCKLNYGSGILLDARGTTEWGSSRSNGGDVTFNATNQILQGNIILDNISTISMNLNTSDYTGTINGDNTAKSVQLNLDKDTTITLTGDSYVTNLNDSDSSYSNINFNGYKLYVNGTAIN